MELILRKHLYTLFTLQQFDVASVQTCTRLAAGSEFIMKSRGFDFCKKLQSTSNRLMMNLANYDDAELRDTLSYNLAMDYLKDIYNEEFGISNSDDDYSAYDKAQFIHED